MSLEDSLKRYVKFIEAVTLSKPHLPRVQKEKLLPHEKGLTPICVINGAGESLFWLDIESVRGRG